MAGGIEATGEIAGPRFEHVRRGIDDVGHFGADLRLALVDHVGKALATIGEGRGDFASALDQRLVDLAGAGFERGIELLRAGVERFGAGLEFADQRLAALGEGPFDVLEPPFELAVELARRAAEQRDHAGRALIEHVGQRARHVVGALGELGNTGVEQAGEGFAGGRDAVGNGLHALVDRFVDRAAALVDAVDQRVAGIGDGHRQLGRRRQDAVADDVADGADFLPQRLVRAGDRSADAFGMGDDRVALVAETVDQRADAGLVLGIGAFELIDLGVNERLELDGTGERALDAFAHGGHLAAHGLADHHDAVIGHSLRLCQAECNLGHRLGGKPHVLGAADHHGKTPEQDHRHYDRHSQHDQVRPRQQGLDRADSPYVRPQQDAAKHDAAAQPGDRQQQDQPIDAVRRIAIERLPERLEILLAIVIGRRKAGRLQRAGVAGDRAPFIGRLVAVVR